MKNNRLLSNINVSNKAMATYPPLSTWSPLPDCLDICQH